MTNATWARIFDRPEPLRAVAAERDGALIGFSHYLFQRSTWLLNLQCYLLDLYVEEDKRRGGVGRPLIGAVVGAAKEAGAPWVFWNTHETNAVARRLYDAVAKRSGFIQYRIEPLADGNRVQRSDAPWTCRSPDLPPCYAAGLIPRG